MKLHWPEYWMEAAGLGIFMISAGIFTTLLEYPASPVRHELANPFLRRILLGLAMGLTAARIYTYKWGIHDIICAKLHHHNDKRCIFRCGYGKDP